MKIESVQAIPLTWQVPQDGPKWVSDYGPRTESHAVLVRVQTDDGLVGYGEVHPGYGRTRGACHTAKAIVEQELGPEILGEDASRPEYVWEKMYNGPRTDLALTYGHAAPRLGRRGMTICALGGIDMALWDIFAQSLGAPIYKLLGGGYRTRIPAYASGGHAPPEHAGEEALRYFAKGFKAMKMRVGGMDAPQQVAGSIARIHAVREAIGAEPALMIDAHGSLNETLALRLAKEAEAYNIAWFEEPTASDNWEGMARVRAATTIPIATGENEFTVFDFRDIIAKGAADILQPDLAVVGGFTAARRIGALTQAANLQCIPHVWGSAILFAASLHLAAALPNCPIFEFRQGAAGYFSDLLEEPPAIDADGCVVVPDKPGLGVTLDLEEAKRKYPFV
jgi:L-alanine-DL-glutamate epimerase-like enolase superfamily enzyme